MLLDHQFGFHHRHSTIQQTYRIANKINEFHFHYIKINEAIELSKFAPLSFWIYHKHLIRCGILDFYINYDYPSLSIT
jgi:hypothetical protein